MADPTELDELQSGFTSGFWQRFVAHAKQEWGPTGATYQQALQKALSGPVGSEAEAIHRLKNVAYAQSQVEALLAWPEQRIAQIKASVERQAQSAGPSRRGAGL